MKISISRKGSEWKSAFEEAVRVRDIQLENIKNRLVIVENELASSKLLLNKKDEELDERSRKIQGKCSSIIYID